MFHLFWASIRNIAAIVDITEKKVKADIGYGGSISAAKGANDAAILAIKLTMPIAVTAKRVGKSCVLPM